MKVILIKDVPKLGRKYEVKDVSSGHALNLLIPQGQAEAATPEVMKRYEKIKTKLEGERKIHEDLLVKNIADLDTVRLVISGKANDKGHLFAGIHKETLVKELEKQTGLQIAESFIDLDQPVKAVGEYKIKVNGGGKSAQFTLVVEADLN
jgi:large subunit ribosomal protein L9